MESEGDGAPGQTKEPRHNRGGEQSNLMLWESLTFILLLSILKVILYSDSCIFDHYNIIFYLIFLNEMKYFSSTAHVQTLMLF